MVRRVAKYDWSNLEKEYILSDYKSINSFFKSKDIPYNSSTKLKTKGWTAKKRQKQAQKVAKTIEKTIEKQAEADAEQLVKVSDVANKLLVKISNATDELNIHTDMFGGQHESIIDRADLKKLTSALKDVCDILNNCDSDEIEDTSETDSDIYG